MHPLTSKGKVVWKGREGYARSLELIHECQAFSKEPLLLNKQVVRPIFDVSDVELWASASRKLPDVRIS
jgi:hypothetical protein